MRSTRAVILPVVLFILLLLGMLAAVFAFRIHADVASTQAVANSLQTRLAAEAGVEWVKLMLRGGRLDRNLWYDNPDAFHRIIVWADNTEATEAGTNEEFDEDFAYRFSIVADDLTDDEDFIRFGLVDEASKLNLNVATEAQLLRLVQSVVADDADTDAQAIVNAILDWRDPDSEPREDDQGTEHAYYRQLPRPYRVKNAPFDTVEELLLVKGVTAQVLFGEDFDRNGLLTDNENDGDLSFPPDNQDGRLNRGLYPLLTVHSYESNVSSTNRERIHLLGPESGVREQLALVFPDEPAIVDFIVSATHQGSGGAQGGGAQGGGAQGGGAGGGDAQGGAVRGGQGRSGPPPRGAAPGSNQGRPRRGSMVPQPQRDFQGNKPPQGLKAPASGAVSGFEFVDGKLAAMAQLRDPTAPDNAENGGDQLESQSGLTDDSQVTGEPSGTQQGDLGDEGDDSESSGDDENRQAEGGTGDVGAPAAPMRSPASLMLPQKIGEDDIVDSPLTPRHLHVLMDVATMRPVGERKIEGLINVNTATRVVLRSVGGFSSEQVDMILTRRDQLDADALLTPAWLLTEGIVDAETFAEVAPFLTARAQQFSIESLGYADHLGTVTRLQVVVDLVGPIAQTVYYRDLSYLGGAYPIREEDLEQQRAH